MEKRQHERAGAQSKRKAIKKIKKLLHPKAWEPLTTQRAMPFMFSQCDGGAAQTQRPLLLKRLAYNRWGEYFLKSSQFIKGFWPKKEQGKMVANPGRKKAKNPQHNPSRNSTMLNCDLSFDQEQTPGKKTGWEHQVPKHRINLYPRWTAPVSHQHLSVSLYILSCQRRTTGY